jgi:DNA-binding transcriptional LysR family regulator
VPGLLPNVVLEVEGIETCKRMVLRRLGLAFLPQLAVTRELKAENFALCKSRMRSRCTGVWT